MAIAVSAQTVNDAYTFSQNDYFGTARTIALGNAVTAIGGDVGSIGINPAGSAVAGYSQVTISPGISFSTNTAKYSPSINDPFSNSNKENMSRFNLTNFGAIMNFDTGRKRGLKSVSYGIVVNRTNKFDNKFLGSGTNSQSSYLGWLADYATRNKYDVDILNGYMDVNGGSIDDGLYPYYNYNAPWEVIVNSQSGAISPYANFYDHYMGATEVFNEDSTGIKVGGPLDQAYSQKISGYKDDIIFNIGFNFSDIFYLGFNLGITSLEYNFKEYLYETALDYRNFVLNDEDPNNPVCFSDYGSLHHYSISGAGVYGKLGFIIRPTKNLRIGAAIQTPTRFDISEDDIYYVSQVNLVNGSNTRAVSPDDSYDYYLRTPYRVNAGIAYTFGGFGFISADYEMTDYSTAKYSEKGDNDFNNSFRDVNDGIKNQLGTSHELRIGTEFRPVPEYSIRAGYTYNVSPTYVYETSSKKTIHDEKNAFSIGAGYSSPGSFFMDLAARLTEWRSDYYTLYEDYLNDGSVPELKCSRSRWDVVLTLGWRF